MFDKTSKILKGTPKHRNLPDSNNGDPFCLPRFHMKKGHFATINKTSRLLEGRFPSFMSRFSTESDFLDFLVCLEIPGRAKVWERSQNQVSGGSVSRKNAKSVGKLLHLGTYKLIFISSDNIKIDIKPKENKETQVISQSMFKNLYFYIVFYI